MHVWIFRAVRIWASEASDVREDVGVVVVVIDSCSCSGSGDEAGKGSGVREALTVDGKANVRCIIEYQREGGGSR